MKNIFNKTNAPYLAGGVLATLTLLASGVFALAPYAGFLAPVAALSVGLPFIVGYAVFSVVTIALSSVVISKNNIISQKEAEAQSYKDKLSTQEPTSLDYLNIDNVPKQPDHFLSIDAAKKHLMSLSEDQETFYDAESGDEKNAEVSSLANEPAKEENGQGWAAWGKTKVAATAITGISLCGAALYYATQYIPTLLNGAVALSVGSECGHTNSTM